MKKSMKLMYGVAVVSCLAGTSLGAWSLNPFNWIKNEDPKPYQEKFEAILEKLEKQYGEPMDLLGSCEMNLQAEDLINQVAELQKMIVVYIIEKHEQEPVIVKQKRDLERLYRDYPCISYRKQLSDDITLLDNAVKEYKKHVSEKNQVGMLLDRASILLINLAVINELIIRSPEFSDESAEYANKYAWHNNRLSDITKLAQTKPHTNVTASIS